MPLSGGFPTRSSLGLVIWQPLLAIARTLPSSLILIGALFLVASCHRPSSPVVTQPELTVAAAADLQPAFEEIGQAFQAQHNVKVTFSFGSSGMLARQIENGAPMDLFASANTDYVDQLGKEGYIIPDTRAIYARGHITLWTSKDSPLKIEQISDLTKSEVKRIAIANPEYAPYGMAARESLVKAGIWDAVKPKIVYGENIRQALQYAETGNVEVAIVALSLSARGNGKWVLIPEELHKPIDQALAVIKSTKDEKNARALASFITSSSGREILKKHGFAFDEAP
jgi:molybdate transport system substrate-binding protein